MKPLGWRLKYDFFYSNGKSKKRFINSNHVRRVGRNYERYTEKKIFMIFHLGNPDPEPTQNLKTALKELVLED